MRGRAEADEVVHRVRIRGELANGDDRTGQRQGRNDRVHSRPVGQAGVDLGARLVDPAAHGGNDPIDDVHDVLVVAEGHVGQLELAPALDVDLSRSVDHHLGHRLVVQERLDRAETRDLRDYVLDQAKPLVTADGEPVGEHDLVDDCLDPSAGVLVVVPVDQ